MNLSISYVVPRATTPATTASWPHTKHRPINSRPPVLVAVWLAQTPCMKAYLKGGADRPAAAPAPPPPSSLPPPITTSLSIPPSPPATQRKHNHKVWHKNSRQLAPQQVWQHFSEFESPIGKRNVKFTLVTELGHRVTRLGAAPCAQPTQCEKLFTHNRADLTAEKKSSGTSGQLSHLIKEYYTPEYQAAIEASPLSTSTRKKRALSPSRRRDFILPSRPGREKLPLRL